jgi:LytS/YehU family sensor histidine kinase
VPRFALQRLVKNAVKHNQDRPGALRVRVHGACDGARLRLVVEDDGLGFTDPEAAVTGTG